MCGKDGCRYPSLHGTAAPLNQQHWTGVDLAETRNPAAGTSREVVVAQPGKSAPFVDGMILRGGPHEGRIQ
jgi:hypothetical protein